MGRLHIESIVGSALLAVLFAALPGCGSGGNLLAAKSWNPFAKKVAVHEPAKSEPMPELTADQRLEVQMTMVQGLERKGALDEALTAYEEMHRKHPRRMDIVNRLAVLHDKKGETDEADRYYRMALERDPHNAEILCDYGYSLYLRGDQVEAERMFRKSLQRNQRLTRAHNNLALVLAHTNRPEAALAEFSYAGSSESQSRVNLAHALMWDQQWPAAEQQLQLAMRAEPHCKPAEQGLAKLRAFQAKHQAAMAPAAPPMQANLDPRGAQASQYVASQPVQYTQPTPTQPAQPTLHPAGAACYPTPRAETLVSQPFAQPAVPQVRLTTLPPAGIAAPDSFGDQVSFEDDQSQSPSYAPGVVSLATENDLAR